MADDQGVRPLRLEPDPHGCRLRPGDQPRCPEEPGRPTAQRRGGVGIGHLVTHPATLRPHGGDVTGRRLGGLDREVLQQRLLTLRAVVADCARLLAAADAYHAMTEDRPHRPGLSAAAAASQLVEGLHAGRFDRTEVDAVLAAAGQASPRPRAAHPAGLTDREIQVLRLIARGRANKQVAAALGTVLSLSGREQTVLHREQGRPGPGRSASRSAFPGTPTTPP